MTAQMQEVIECFIQKWSSFSEATKTSFKMELYTSALLITLSLTSSLFTTKKLSSGLVRSLKLRKLKVSTFKNDTKKRWLYAPKTSSLNKRFKKDT